MTSLHADTIAAQLVPPRDPTYITALLRDEARRGHTQQRPDGRWTLTPSFAADFGAALRDLRDEGEER